MGKRNLGLAVRIAVLLFLLLSLVLTSFGRDSSPAAYANFTQSEAGESAASGPYGNIATAAPPIAPNSPSPADGAIQVLADPVLSWSGGDPDAGDIVTYTLFLTTTNPPTTEVYSGTVRTYNSPVSLSHNTVYYWQVVATDSQGGRTDGPVWHFTTLTGNNPPNLPSAPNPADGATGVAVNTNLYWTGGDPDEDDVDYWIYLGTNPDSLPLVKKWKQPFYNPPTDLLPNTDYYWKVEAEDALDLAPSEPAPVWRFRTVTANAPTVPNNPSPADDATNVPVGADLSWTGGDPDAGDVVTYTVYLDKISDPAEVVYTGTSTTYDPPANLAPSTDYYWKVEARDNTGLTTESDVWHFTTQCVPPGIPPVPNLLSPADGATVDTTTPILDWEDIAGSYCATYNIRIENDGGEIVDGPWSPPSSEYTPPSGALSLGNHYFWYVSAVNSLGSSEPITRSLWVGNRAPYTPSNPTPAHDATNISPKAGLRWSGGDPDLGDTVTYTVYIDIVANPTTPAICADPSNTSCNPPRFFVPETDYYWQVLATDSHGVTSLGPIWHFRTGRTGNFIYLPIITR